jgi:ADP-ribose diphosphatase
MKVTRVEKLTAEKWLNLFAAHYEHNGKGGRWVFASRRERPGVSSVPDAVLIAAVLHAPAEPPRLVLLKEYRIPVAGYTYGLPAGLLEAGESVEDAVRREMLEETGLEVTRIHRVSPPLYSSTGMTDENAVLVFADVRATPETKQKLDATEDIEVLLLDYAGVCRLSDHTDLPIDAKAWQVLHLYRTLGKLD